MSIGEQAIFSKRSAFFLSAQGFSKSNGDVAIHSPAKPLFLGATLEDWLAAVAAHVVKRAAATLDPPCDGIGLILHAVGRHSAG